MHNLFKKISVGVCIAVGTTVGCNQVVIYDIPSNLDKSYKVRLGRDEITIYDGSDRVARLDTTISLSYFINHDGQQLLLEEGPRITALYDIMGNWIGSRPGKVLYASGDTILFSGQLLDYTEEGQPYHYLFVDKINQTDRVDRLSCVYMIKYQNRNYIYVEDLNGVGSLYDLSLAPVLEVPITVPEQCVHN
jgi:hypothetical protein